MAGGVASDRARARRSAAPSPRQALPCMQARVWGCSAGEALEGGGGLRGVGVVVHLPAEGFARAEDVAFGERLAAVGALGEEVAAEEGARLELHHEAALPAVRDVRGVEPLEGAAAGAQDFAVGEGARGARGDVVDRHHRGHLAADGRGGGGQGEEVVQGAAFVGLEVREGDVAQALGRQDLADRFGDEREKTGSSLELMRTGSQSTGWGRARWRVDEPSGAAGRN